MSDLQTKTFACAHRGDSSRYRENTIVAIQSAIDAGAEVVEIDVRITRDGKVIVLHDSNLERLWGITKDNYSTHRERRASLSFQNATYGHPQ